MRRKYAGYIFQFTRSDHDGRHIHVLRDGKPIGVYDQHEGPIRGLDRHWNNALRDALRKFIKELNERGYFVG